MKLGAGDVKTYPASVDLHAPDALRTLFLQFEHPDWEQELAAFWHTDVEIPATLGFFAATVRLPVPPILSGVIVGVLTSVPDAVITKAYAPIMITGVICGAISVWIVGRCGRLARAVR